MAKKTIDIELILSGEDKINNAKTQIRALQQEAANLQLAGDNDAQLEKVINRLATMRDEVNDVNERIGVLTSGSGFEKMANNLGDVGSKLASLDFEGASESAGRLSALSKSITFADAKKGVMDFGKTILSIGKALLTNPLFLLATVIIGVVYAIYKLLDSLGIIKKVLDVIGKVIDWIVDLFYAFTDAIGLTDKAGEKFAENQIKRNQELIESEKERSAEMQGNLNRQLRVLEAQGKDTKDLEIKIAKDKRQSALNQMQSIKMIIDAEIKKAMIQGEMDEETVKRLKDLKKEYKSLVQTYKDANTDIQVINIKANENEKKENAKSVEDAKKSAKEKADAHKAYLQDRLNASRQIKDLENNLITDQYQREIAINNTKYQRLIEDTKRNEKLLANEKKALIALYNAELQVANKAVEDKKKADDAKVLEDQKKALEDFSKFRLGLEANEYIVQIEQSKMRFEEEKRTLDEALQNKLISQDQYNSLVAEAEQNNINRINEMRQLDAEITEQDLQLKYEAGLVSEEEYQNKLNEIKKKKAQEALDTALELQKKEFNDKLNVAQDYFNGVSSLTNSLFTIAENNNKKDAKAKLELAKKKFKTEKALAIVQTGIQGARAVVEAAPNVPMMVFAGLTAAASIAAIASKQFDGENASGGSSSGSTPSATPESTSPTTPAFNLFGSGGTANNGGPTPSAEAGQGVMQVNVSISESEITNTQNTVSQIKQSSTL